MSVGVEGNENRVAGRDYLEINVGPEADKEPLSSAQRQKLNALVASVSETLEIDPRQVWREVVHAKLGVESIHEIPRTAFDQAYDAVIHFRDTEREFVNVRLMVSRITSLTKEKKIYEERDSFCLRTFGERHLNHMNKDQLRKVLAYVEDYEVKVVPQDPIDGFSLSGIALVVLAHPVHFAATLILGIIVGQIIL
ncbi:hypothetical protein [uncultured Halopseudomonas sp.]|mgnify:CR=1 FL=1|uniref:hypothetical protein n=1 Tax=uncultured Halopseudomonas sp. TaxID=2901193 RepID=UPI0030EED1FD